MVRQLGPSCFPLRRERREGDSREEKEGGGGGVIAQNILENKEWEERFIHNPGLT